MSEATHLQRRTWFTQYRTSDVAENVGSTFLVRIVYSPGERVCIDSNGKNGKSRGCYFGSGFRQSVIIAELWQPEVARPGNIFSNFCRFLEKRPLTVKYSKFCSNVSPPHRSTLLCLNFAKCCRREIGEIVRYLLDQTKHFLVASQTVATARIAPKICHGHPPNNVLTVLQILSKSVHFRQCCYRTRERRFLPRRLFPL